MPEPDVWTPKGRDQVVLSGLVSEPGDLGEAGLLAMERALGATVDNPDEPVGPVVCDVASGFFRVDDIVCDPGDVGLAVGWMEYEATLTRVANSSMPTVSSAVLAHLRPNQASLTAAAFFHAVPAAAVFHSWPAGLYVVDADVEEVRDTDLGAGAGGVRYRRYASGGGQTAAVWSCAPEHWHDGGCHVETRADGEWLPVVGRGSLTGSWRITNGLVTVTILEAGAAAGRLRCAWHRPVAVSSLPPYTREFGVWVDNEQVTEWVGAEVLRLAPHVVAIRVHVRRSDGRRATMTITLRRGDRNVAITLDGQVLGGYELRPEPGVATVTVGSHAQESSSSSGGSKWYMASTTDVTVDTSTGRFQANVLSPSWSATIGVSTAGAGGDSQSRFQSINQWLAVQSELAGFTP